MTAFDLRQQPWFDAHAYPFTSHFLPLPMGRMHYLDEGSGPPVVLVHGTPGWSWEYREVVKALSPHFRCIVPDHIGFGLSDKPAGWDYTLQGHTENLRALLRHLSLERFALVVHDFGGPVALPLALEAPGRVERLVVMNSWLWPFSDVDPTFEKQRRMLKSGLVRWLYRRANLSARVIVKQAWGTHAPLTRAVHRHYTGAFPDEDSRGGTLGFLRAVVDEDAYLTSLWQRAGALAELPSLVLWGTGDRFIPTQHLERWRGLMKRAEVVELPRVGHFPQDEAGEEVGRRIRAFLEGASQAQRVAPGRP